MFFVLQEARPVLLKQSQQSIASIRPLIRTSPQSPLTNLLFHKFDYSKSDIISRQLLIAESFSFPSSSAKSPPSQADEEDKAAGSEAGSAALLKVKYFIIGAVHITFEITSHYEL